MLGVLRILRALPRSPPTKGNTLARFRPSLSTAEVRAWSKPRTRVLFFAKSGRQFSHYRVFESFEDNAA